MLYTPYSPILRDRVLVLDRSGKTRAGVVEYVYSTGYAVNVRFDDEPHALHWTLSKHVVPEPKELPKMTTTNTDDFTRAAVKAVVRLAQRQPTITTDDVWAAIPTNVTTHERRAMGAIMVECAKSGLITKTDRVVKSTREACHQRPIAVWKSERYKGK